MCVRASYCWLLSTFSAGIRLYMGRTGEVLCPVSAMLGYLAIRPPNQGPAIRVPGWHPIVTREIDHLALSKAGINTANFSGHSFRIGAATTAARAGLSDSFIQMLGRWKSAAFTAYIRTPREDLVAVTAKLARSH